MDRKRDIDRIIEIVKERVPDVCIEQLKVTHPADDDGIWYFGYPGQKEMRYKSKVLTGNAHFSSKQCEMMSVASGKLWRKRF